MAKIISLVFVGCTALTITRQGLGQRWDDSAVCASYACATDLPPGVCSLSNSSTVRMQSCPPLYECDRDSSQLGTCKLLGAPKGLPGDPCAGDESCESDICSNHTCYGKGFQEPCKHTSECDRGFFCSDNICWKQLSPYSKGCKSEFDCENGSTCRFFHERNSTCLRYFSEPKYAWVSDCMNYFSRTCQSATCLAPGGTGQGICIDPIVSDPLQARSPCRVHSDCDSLSSQFTFYGLCQCGGSSKATKYCAPFPGDPSGKAMVELLVAWYNTTTVQSCHTLKRESEECIAKWERGTELITAYVAYQHAVMLTEAEQCVVETLYPAYAPQPSVSAAATLVLAALVVL